MFRCDTIRYELWGKKHSTEEGNFLEEFEEETDQDIGMECSSIWIGDMDNTEG